MNGMPTIGDKETITPLPRLYLRPDEAARVIGVSRRTLCAIFVIIKAGGKQITCSLKTIERALIAIGHPLAKPDFTCFQAIFATCFCTVDH
jgi:hypothetical protein